MPENNLKPKEAGLLFEKYATIDKNGYSNIMSMEELVKIHPGFKTSNGCSWARSSGCYLGNKYNVKRYHEGSRVSGVQLMGFKQNIDNHDIPAAIRAAHANERCVILDIGTNPELDHKNARYNQDTYEVNDFQVLCKTANDAKRQHCKECREQKKRYDATILGYTKAFTSGDFNSNTCVGCYWHDPYAFNRIISGGNKG